ncbi:Fur-regulated basic protein FbpA [Bacillus thuringiensis]|uniref:Fur-regulated basic protein FbpA n=1 Tax=Bacillus thuringiensis TaxID=1428 RepID=UPI001D0ACD6E|nr:Fur-regulated basic protein FbpA [Bacillus thuringiensis]
MLHDLLLKEIYIEALIRRNVFKMEDGRDLWQASNEELHAQLFDEEGNLWHAYQRKISATYQSKSGT